MPADKECSMLERLYPDLVGTKVILKLVQVANLIRQAFISEDVALTFSNRGLRASCSLIDRDLSPVQAMKLTYLSKLASESEIEAVVEFMSTCGLRT